MTNRGISPKTAENSVEKVFATEKKRGTKNRGSRILVEKKRGIFPRFPRFFFEGNETLMLTHLFGLRDDVADCNPTIFSIVLEVESLDKRKRTGRMNSTSTHAAWLFG